MADVTSGEQSQTFASPADNARDMADQIMGDLDAGVPEAGPDDRDMGWEAGDGHDQEAYDLGFSDENPSELESESAGVTVSSPGSGPTNPAPAPQLDSNQQFQMQMLQQFQAMQMQNQALIESLRPKAEPPPPPDPFEGMDADLRAEVEANPQLKKFVEWQTKMAATPAQKLQKDLEQRIQAATYEREVQRFSQEADQVAQSVVGSGYAFEPGEANVVTDLIRDMSLALSDKDVHGGSPSKFATPLKNAFDKAVNAKIRHLNSQAKAKVGQRNPGAPAQARSQAAGPGIPQGQNRIPTNEEARQAGYKNASEAALDGDRKVLKMWAAQGRR